MQPPGIGPHPKKDTPLCLASPKLQRGEWDMNRKYFSA